MITEPDRGRCYGSRIPGARPAETGFTLTEILAAAVLLSLSLVAMTTLWSFSRRITEGSRNTAERYAVARREVERDRALGFNSIFNVAPPIVFLTSDGTYQSSPHETDYDEQARTQSEAANSSSWKPYYRARSTYYLRPTSGENDPLKWLGIQVVEVFPYIEDGTTRTPASTPSYTTTAFYTVAGL